MGIFCTVRAFMRFRGREALRDTYQKHGGVPVIVNQESDNWRVPRSNPSEQIGWWGVLPDRGGSCIAIDAGTNSPLGDNTARSAGKRFCRAGRRPLQRRQVKALGLRELMGGLQELMESRRHGGRGACPGSGRVRWARAAQHPPAGGPLDDQRDSPAGGCRLDDDLWQDVYSVYARPNGVAIGKQMGLGLSFLGRPLSAGHFSRTLRCAAPGSGVGTVRARALGTVPGASSGFPGADPFSVWHCAGDFYAIGAACGGFRQRVRPPGAKRRPREFRRRFVALRQKRRNQKLETRRGRKSKAGWRPEGRRYATLQADFSRSSWMRVW